MDVSFQRIAPYYDTLAKLVFGNTIDHAQKAFFSLIPKGSSVLIIGGGTGRILTDLIKNREPKHITFIEASSAMLHKAEKRFERLDHALTDQVDTCFLHGTEKQISADQHYDVLMTFFLLDLYPTHEAKALSSVLSAHLRPSGSWLFADFCLQGNAYRQCWQNILLKIMYNFFRLTSNLQNQSLPDYQQIFKELGYFPVQQKYYYKNFIVSTIYRKLLA
jgi:tRNA (cmo5U34)-methyltransferase